MADETKTPLLPPGESSDLPSYAAINGGHEGRQPTSEPLPPTTQETKVFKRRWYLLLLLSMMSATQVLIWNTWGPISHTVEYVYGWDGGDISLLANWGPIMYTLLVPAFAWMLDTKGIRWAVVTAMTCVAIGAGVRCIPIHDPTAHKWVTHMCQMFNAMGGPVGGSAMPVLSAQWFPPSERATATAIPLVAKMLSLASSYIFGPLMVPDVPDNSNNSISSNFFLDQVGNITNHTGPSIQELKDDIALYVQLEAGLAGVVFILILIYFPSKPPCPPCISAAAKREDFVQGIKLLFRNWNFWLMAILTGMAFGFDSAWISVLSLNLKPVGAGQEEAGWVGFYSFLSTCAAMLIMARVGDYFSRKMKWFISLLLFITGAMYMWFAFICIKLLPYSSAYIYLTIIAALTALNAANPLIYELTCEISYPVGEGTTCGALTGVQQAVCIVFLFIMMIPNIGSMWLNWAVTGAMLLSTVLVLLVKEQHRRLELDITVEKS